MCRIEARFWILSCLPLNSCFVPPPCSFSKEILYLISHFICLCMDSSSNLYKKETFVGLTFLLSSSLLTFLPFPLLPLLLFPLLFINSLATSFLYSSVVTTELLVETFVFIQGGLTFSQYITYRIHILGRY